jgi:PAS domain S-box-containing protein
VAVASQRHIEPFESATTPTGGAGSLEPLLLSEVLDAARIGAWQWNLQTGQLRLNARWAEMLGYTLAELEPITIETCARLRHPEDQAAALLKAERHLAGLEPYFEAEVRMRHKAGHWVWVLDRARLVSRSDDGRPLLMVGSHEDVTARKTFESRLGMMTERLRLCMDIAGLGVWDKNLDSGDFSFDDTMRGIYGLDGGAEPITSDLAMARVHPEDRALLLRDGRLALETAQPVQSRFRVVRPDGVERHVHGHAVASTGCEGRPVLLGVNRDITDEVHRRMELESKRVEAEAAAVAKGQFLATMSHEIRTPMNGVIGMLQVLCRADLPPTQKEHAHIALQSANHLRHILDDVLDVSRLEAGHVQLDPVAFETRALVNEVAELFGKGVLKPGVELGVDIAASVPKALTADQNRLRQVLTNFVGNAVKFTEAGRIVVEADYDIEQQRLRLAVRDSGIGVAPEACERLFQRFVQADASMTRRYGGTGLGLAICRQIADLMGGQVGVESELGKGSLFWLEIPAAAAEEEAREDCQAATEAGRHLRLLVAEDNETNQRVIGALLSSFGHSFMIVPDGAQAVAAASSGDFDAILMDVQMPVMDGPTATRRIRALGGRASMLPIIALTANAMPGQRAEYLAAGMTDYLSKPLDVAALYEALARVG